MSTGRKTLFALILFTLSAIAPPGAQVAKGENRFAYQTDYVQPYYPHGEFPKLITPQWVGEDGVDTVITLGIDDMRDTAAYEAYLRPILRKLKEIDNRAPVSIMTCSLDPQDPQLQQWLNEGLSIEVHTADHPCPCLQGDNFDAAKSTYDRCVDLMASIPGNHPVAFRTPCCDSRNTPSPRLWSEIFNQRTPQGNFLQADSSVFNVFTKEDKELPPEWTTDANGQSRFRKYIPFPSFVNTIENYPYPYVIGKRCWQFPCMVPSDWEAQNLHQPNNPVTVEDMKVALDATVLKKGMFNLVFHPHGWIKNEQVVELIEYADKKYGKRIKFLNFKECVDRINKHLLLDQPIRAPETGSDNGVRLVDVNEDGFLDVLIGNESNRTLRLWKPNAMNWQDTEHGIQFTSSTSTHSTHFAPQIGKIDPESSFSVLVNHEHDQAIYDFSVDSIRRTPLPVELKQVKTSVAGLDQGIRLRDMDRDGHSELIIANPKRQAVLRRNEKGQWKEVGSFPAAIVDAKGKDNGVRFIDVDEDGNEDVIFNNGKDAGIYLFDAKTKLFSRKVETPSDLPLIVRNGTNNGVWFAKKHLWVQNENTNRLPDGVDRRSFQDLLGSTEPGPRDPQQSLKSIQVPEGFRVELVAAEPLVMDPIAIDWGADGKLWVVEMADYPLGLDDQGKPGGRVRFLEDSDGDGLYDKSTLFLDGIAYPTGIMAWQDGVLISAAPSIFFAADRNGDGVAETIEERFKGFAEGNQQHRVNGFERGLDNWIYVANGDSGGEIESIKTGQRLSLGGQDLRILPERGIMELQTGRTQFGRHRDDHGNWFGCSNPLPVRHFVLADHYTRRNPFLTFPSPRLDIARVDNTQLFPISRILSHWSGYRPPESGAGHQFTSACSTSIYRDDLFGKDFNGDTFTCAPVHNLVHRRKLIPDGISFQSIRPKELANQEFLASTDSWFRPATVTTGPEGALWVVDMYRLVIEHPEWIDDQREKELFLRAGCDQGRIYRVLPVGHSAPQTLNLISLSSSELTGLLESSNGRTRDLAQQELISRADPNIETLLKKMVTQSSTEMGRLHAMCTLDGLGQIHFSTLQSALKDPSPTVRRHAIRLCEPLLASSDPNLDQCLETLGGLVSDPDPMVRMQLAYTLGEAEGENAASILVSLAQHSVESPYLRASITSSLHEENLIAFHQGITEKTQLSTLYQPIILQMASRMKRADFIAVVLKHFLDNGEENVFTAEGLNSLNQMLETVQQNLDGLPASTLDRLEACMQKAVDIGTDETMDTERRVAAIGLCSRSQKHRQHIEELLNARHPIDVQIASAEAVAAFNPEAILNQIQSFSPNTRTAAIEALLSNRSTSLLLIESLKQGETPTNLFSLVHQQRLIRHADKEVAEQAASLFESLENPISRTELITHYQSEMMKPGNFEAGKKVFKTHCSSCHRVMGTGNEVGPNLSAIKNRSREAMLTAILVPEAAVEDKYLSYNLLTIDGAIHTGIIEGETSTTVELLLADGKKKSILRSEIETMQNSGLSLMPQGLEKSIPPSDMCDLIEFISKLGSNHDTAMNSQAKPSSQTINVDKEGTTLLTAADCQIHGTNMRFEKQYGNIGFWNDATEFISWNVAVTEPKRFEITIDYAVPTESEGNLCQITAGTQTLSKEVKGTGNWDTYRTMTLGTLSVPKGESTIKLGASGTIRQWLMDFRSLTLTPVSDQP